MALHFLRPYWFLALILVVFFLWSLRLNFTKGDGWQQVIDPRLISHLLAKSDIKKFFLPLWLIVFIWIVTIIALAGPTWEKRNQPVYKNEAAKVILLDLSQSMLAQDIKPSRLARAKYKILDILKDYPEGQTGMAVFSSEAYTVSPLTNDTHTIALMVPDLSPDIMPVRGHNIAAGLQKAADLLKQAQAKSGEIILITDSSPTREDAKIANTINHEGYTLSILAMGTAQGAPIPAINSNFEQRNGKTIISKLNVPGLELLAQTGGGGFSTFTNSDKDIHYLLQPTLAQHHLNKAKAQNHSSLWVDEGRWFILLILPLALVAFRRGWLEELSR